MRVTFDKSVAGIVLDAITKKQPHACLECKATINNSNFGGAMMQDDAPGLYCNKALCLVKMAFRIKDLETANE